MKIDFANFSDHELQVAVEVMDMNWDVVMRGQADPCRESCQQCGHRPAPLAPIFVQDHVFERHRAVEEQQRRIHGPDAGNYSYYDG